MTMAASLEEKMETDKDGSRLVWGAITVLGLIVLGYAGWLGWRGHRTGRQCGWRNADTNPQASTSCCERLSYRTPGQLRTVFPKEFETAQDISRSRTPLRTIRNHEIVAT